MEILNGMEMFITLTKYSGVKKVPTANGDYLVSIGASGDVMIRELDKQTYTNVFESHWMPHSYGLVPLLSKKAM